LLLQLFQAAVDYYVGNLFVGTLAYADSSVLLTPTPTDTRKMLSICDRFAADNDIYFNISKSDCVIIDPKRARHCILHQYDSAHSLQIQDK
jgi:hypothetical protein